MNRKNVQRLVVVIVGSILGAVAGNAIGAAIRSDNLPFFVLLGAVIGLCGSGVLAVSVIR